LPCKNDPTGSKDLQVEADGDPDPTRVGPYLGGDHLVWMTLDELTEVLGASRASAREFAVRRGLPTRFASGGRTSLFGVRGVEPWSASVPRGVAEARPNAAGQLLYRLRQKAEISQSELGARVDVPQAVIARYERGDIDDKLTMQFICRVAEACGAAMGLGEWRTAERGAHRVGPAGGEEETPENSLAAGARIGSGSSSAIGGRTRQRMRGGCWTGWSANLGGSRCSSTWTRSRSG